MATVDERLDKMGKWAAGIDEQLGDIKQALYVTVHERADGISMQLADLLDKRSQSGNDYHTALVQKGELGVDIAELKERIDTIESNAYLDASCTYDENGKPLYSNDTARKAAAAQHLNENDQYVALKMQLRDKEREQVRVRALLETLDLETKEFGYAVNVLCSRLDNLTARVVK